MHTGIIADDLTSAADGGAPFARYGHRVHVALGIRAAYPANGADVVALDLDTRACTVADASLMVSEAGLRLRGAQLLCKTMDSTLRGHIGAEITAALLASGRDAALVAPAFPAAGRTTLGGVQHVDGVPVERTAFARDLNHPVAGSRIARLFDGAGLCPVVELSGAEARNPSRVRQALATAQIVIADAATDGDLDALVAAVDGDGTSLLWVGSPGIAQALARACPAKQAGPLNKDAVAHHPLVLVGSLHPASRVQADALAAVTTATVIEVHSGADSQDWQDAEIERACEACRRAIPGDSPLIIRSAGRLAPGTSRIVASILGAVAMRLVAEGLVDGLIATGGDTALAAARALGADGFQLRREVEPGIAMGILAGPHPLPMITKAGGFGDASSLVRLCQVLRDPSSARERIVQ